MIRIILKPPVVPHKVQRITGKKMYRSGDNTYCLNVLTVGALDVTTNLLAEAGVEVERTEDVK